MRVNFSLPVKPFSINAAYYKTRSIKTKDARIWEQSVFKAMKHPDVQNALMLLRAEFNPKIYSYHAEFKFYFPTDIFWTAEQTVSGRTFDLSNIEKMLIDLIWLPRYHNSPLSSFTSNLNIDDKYLTKLISEKLPGESHKIEIIIELVDLKNFQNLANI